MPVQGVNLIWGAHPWLHVNLSGLRFINVANGAKC